MSKLNKAEIALWEEYHFKVIPPFHYHIYRTGTIKRGDIEYKSTLFYPQVLYGNIERGRVLYYDKSKDLKNLLDNTIEKYRHRMQLPVEDVWYEYGTYYVKGYAIYENGKNSHIFLEDGCPTNVYCYPNGDICIFEGKNKIVIANSLEYWEYFKTTPKSAKYDKSNETIGLIVFIILVLIVITLMVLISEFVDFIFGV